MDCVTEVCRELQALCRVRTQARNTRIKIHNRLCAMVAGSLGYRSGLNEGERKKMFAAAASEIKRVRKEGISSEFDMVIMNTLRSLDGFDEHEHRIGASMVALAKQLPLQDWMEDEERRGFGWGLLAWIVGETGDLCNYANPAKLWRRMGCAPFSKGGKTQMPSTWRREGGLTSEDWTECGNCRRRRSVSWQVGKNLMMQNRGSYRRRYEEAKSRMREAHPEKSNGYPDSRVDLHAQLMATKLLLKDLWVVWQTRFSRNSVPDFEAATV